MPPIATATAIDAAPVTPAASKSGANARPVAGPPVSVTEPASTPNKWMQAERQRDQDADHVLQDRKHGSDQKESQHLRTADPQQRQTRPKTDRREEGDHQRTLQRRIELEERHLLLARNENSDGHQQAAHHRRPVRYSDRATGCSDTDRSR